MLTPGSTLGPYKILGPLGEGGMGEVYRARDTRLSRDVALKVIAREFASDRDRVKRFEQEALAAGALNHPNVVSILDVGIHDGSPFVVMELLEGESLRAKLADPIPARRAMDYGKQAAWGLAAAHEKGIIHRDLKPENLFITKDGRVKVLDFGLAKLSRPDMVAPSADRTVSVVRTQSGVIQGTVGYMAPEQIRGQATDARTDIFSLGIILYEMATGQRAFPGSSEAERLTAPLTHDPPHLSKSGREIPPGLETVVRRCLEKEPAQRFQSVHAVAVSLEVVEESLKSGVIVPPTPVPPSRKLPRLLIGAAVALLLAGSLSRTFDCGAKNAKRPIPTFSRITFRRGIVDQARFAPDGQTVVYSARWQDEPPEMFAQRLGTADARQFGLQGASPVGIVGGEMAILRGGTLARVPLEGGTPRDIVENVLDADWGGDGSKFLVFRDLGDRRRLECPIGKSLLETSGSEEIKDARLSPGGDRIAFIHKENSSTATADIVLLDLAGKKQVLSKGWPTLGGLAWSPNGREVWFTGARQGTRRALHAVTLTSKERMIARVAGDLELMDIAPDGRALLAHGQTRWETRGKMSGDPAERDFSWLDGTLLPVLAQDGMKMVFQEFGEGGGALGSTYFQKMDGSLPVRLGDGAPFDVSPDWKRVVSGVGSPMSLQLVPIGAGEASTLPRGSIQTYQWARWHPDGKRIVFVGNEAGRGRRLYVQPVSDGPPRPASPEQISVLGFVVSPDGRFCAARPPGPRAPYLLYPLDGGEPRPIPGIQVEDEPMMWSEDGRSLFVQIGGMPAKIVCLNLQTGARQPWLELAPPDRAGTSGIATVGWITPNGRFYTYSYSRTLSDLYLASGAK